VGKHGGFDVSDAKRLRALEDQNGKLKKLLADAMLDNGMLKEIAAKKWRRLLSGERPSLRFVWRLKSSNGGRVRSALGVDRTSVRYRSRRADDEQLRARLRESAVNAGALAIAVCT
jgi:putative transposase